MIEFLEVKTRLNAEKIENLANKIWHEHYRNILPTGQIEYMLNKFQSAHAVMEAINGGYRYYILRDSGAEVGYFGIKADEKGLFLSKLYLLKKFRGHGLGKECINFITDKAKKAGLKCLHLTVNKHNKNSIAAYKKLGFVVYGTSAADIGGGYAMEDDLMEKVFTFEKV